MNRTQPQRQNYVLLTVCLLVSAFVIYGCVAPDGSSSFLQPITSADVNSARDSSDTTADTITADDTADSNTTESEVATSAVELVATETFEGIPVGFTEDGFAFRGSPDAPVTMYEYSDYQCPFCRRHFLQTEPALNESYIESGLIKVVFLDFPLEQLHPNAPAAHVAALCSAEQGAAAFWEMHNLLFETQDEWGRSPEPNTLFSQLAAQVGVDMPEFESCINSGRRDAMVQMGVSHARSLGFSGTPSFQFVMESTGDSYQLVGAQPYDRFVSWIDSMLAGNPPADAAAEAPPEEGGGEIPFWATADGLAPDPDHPGYTMAGDQYQGAEDAAVIVIEYSDFQCPFCRRHTENTQPILDETFVDTGEVRWVFKHFPLNIHPQAPMAGVAAECAAEQGQFWEMSHALFASVQSWSNNNPAEALIAVAEDVGVSDIDTFSACLDDEEMMARVQSDFAEGRQFVQGTPTFIVMFNGEGRIIPGALPADQFVDALNQILAMAGQ